MFDKSIQNRKLNIDVGYDMVKRLKTKFVKQDLEGSDDENDRLKNCLADMFLSIVVNYEDDDDGSDESTLQAANDLNFGTVTNDQGLNMGVNFRSGHETSRSNHRNESIQSTKSSNEKFHPLAIQDVFELGRKQLEKIEIVKV